MHNVFQTWKTNNVPYSCIESQKTWINSNFYVHLVNDTIVFKDVHEFCKKLETYQLCNKINQFTKIQLIDIWRYIKIYNEGGIYVDIDIGLKKREILSDMCDRCNLVIFRESPTFFSEPFKFILFLCKYVLGFTDHPRFYQYRQSIFYASLNHPLLRDIINDISDKDIEITKRNFVEPQYTFELTGPGIFTDYVQMYSHLETTCIVEYNTGLDIIDYHHMGSWRINYEQIEYILLHKNIIIAMSVCCNILFMCVVISHSKISLFCSKI